MGVAVIVAVAMIMVVTVAVVMVTFAGEKYWEQEHQAGDEGRSPGIAQVMGREERIEGHVAGERPGAKVVGEDPEALEAGVVGAALDVDREEAGEEHGGQDQEEDREGGPAFDGVVMDLIGLLLEVGGDGGLSLAAVLALATALSTSAALTTASSWWASASGSVWLM